MSTVSPTVLTAWALPEVTAVPLASGLINPTWRLDGRQGPVGVLQQLNTTIFHPSVHHDIEAVTAHLAAKGLTTPRLVRTRAGGLWHTDDDGGVWRILSHVGDRTIQGVDDLADARSGGRLVARVHAALVDLDHAWVSPRRHAHDTPRHATTLREALTAHARHRLFDRVAPLAEHLLASWDALASRRPHDLPARTVHGDLKISNLRFADDEAVALIDLDTWDTDTLDAELGDLLRSWCGTAGEDSTQAVFDLDVLEAAMTGYAEGAGDDGPTDAEWDAIVFGAERITTELAMRFAADALNEAYFGWDRQRFPGRGEHNLVRARGQANLARAIGWVRDDAEARVRRARGR